MEEATSYYRMGTATCDATAMLVLRPRGRPGGLAVNFGEDPGEPSDPGGREINRTPLKRDPTA